MSCSYLERALERLIDNFHDGNIKIVITDNNEGKKTIEVVANDTRR